MKKLCGHIVAALPIFLFGIPASLSAAEPERNAESFEKLRAECVKLAPSGWAVELTLVNDANPQRPGECPALIIRSEQSVPVEYHVPNPSSAGETLRKTEPVSIRLIAQPYVSQIEYAAKKRRNEESLNQRLTMAKKLKAEKIASAFMGPDPIPPSGFRPNSYTEIRLIWEYAFLWLETELEPLPTHRFEILTLKVDVPQNVTIGDKKIADEFKSLAQAVQSTLTSYDAPAAKSK